MPDQPVNSAQVRIKRSLPRLGESCEAEEVRGGVCAYDTAHVWDSYSGVKIFRKLCRSSRGFQHRFGHSSKCCAAESSKLLDMITINEQTYSLNVHLLTLPLVVELCPVGLR